MESVKNFWATDKTRISKMCEDKDCRLFWDNLQEIFYIVKKYPDRSVLHTTETELFSSHDINAIDEFIKNYKKIIA